MTITEHVLSLARAYADHESIALSTVGFRATNHGGFFARLEGGGTITDYRYQRIVAWFRANWPTGLPWVEIIHRSGEQNVNAAVTQGDAA